MQKKRIESKRMQIKPTANVKIMLNINGKCQQNQEKCPGKHYLILKVISEYWIIFV